MYYITDMAKNIQQYTIFKIFNYVGCLIYISNNSRSSLISFAVFFCIVLVKNRGRPCRRHHTPKLHRNIIFLLSSQELTARSVQASRCRFPCEMKQVVLFDLNFTRLGVRCRSLLPITQPNFK